jgi:hypothetical protein
MSTAPIPRGQEGPPLSAQTLAWLAEQPPAARTLVHRVWTTLTDRQQSGHHPNPSALAALLAKLLEHQPSPRTGRCRACPRRHSWHHRWQRPHFPCPIWITTDLQLQDPFRGTRRPRRGVAPSPRADRRVGSY